MHTALAWAAQPRHPQRTVLQWASLPHSLKTTEGAVWLSWGDEFSSRQGVRARVDQLHPSPAGEAINLLGYVQEHKWLQDSCGPKDPYSEQVPTLGSCLRRVPCTAQQLHWVPLYAIELGVGGGCEASEFLVALWDWHILHPFALGGYVSMGKKW